MQKIVKNCIVAFFVFVFALWAFIVLIVPLILNSDFFISKISDLVFKSTKNVLILNNPEFFVHSNLNAKFTCSEILVKNANQTLILKGVESNFSPFNFKTDKFIAKKIFLQKTGVNFVIKKPKTKNNKFDYAALKMLPEILIDDAFVDLKTSENTSVHFDIDTIRFINSNSAKILSFNLHGFSDYLLKDIKLTNKSKFYFLQDGIYVDNLKVYFFDSLAIVKGKIFDTENEPYFLVNGNNLPAKDIINCTLLLLKRQNNKKYFIENFKNFKGKLDLSLYYEQNGLYGQAKLNNFGAQTLPLSIPLFFKKLDFIFENKEIYMKGSGLFGGERCQADFYLTDLFTDKLKISGNINSKVSNSFAKKYIEGLFIKGKVFLSVDYQVQNGIVDVIYKASLEPESDIYYLKSRLGLWRLNRTVIAYTTKKEDIIRLIKYSYLVSSGKKQTEIISGTGLFSKRKNKKFAIDRISVKTKKDAPVSLLGFIESNLKGGRFNGQIEYDFINSKLNGSLILSNSRFKGFIIKEAAIFANNNTISILTHGTLKNEIYNAIIELKNSLDSALTIYNFDIFLKKYELEKSSKKKRNFKPFFDDIEVKRNIDVKKLVLRLDEFKKGNIVIKNLLMNGHVKNNILYFNMNDALFADGFLGAVGFFDFNKKTSVIDFSARDIDAKIASYQVFNLKDHIKGLASAKLRLELLEGFMGYKGTAVFNVEKGALTKFGTKEFLVKGSKKKSPYKFSLSKIIKIDKNASIPVESNIKGFFNFYGPDIEDINIIVQNDLISFYIEGCYNIKTQFARLNLWGKYDREFEKNISIFHIPLSFVYKIIFKVKEQKDKYLEKLLKIPSLKNSKDMSKTFNVGLEGNINDTKTLKFQFKDIR